MSNKHINLIAYEGFENLRNFNNLIGYRNTCLLSAQKYVSFFKRIFRGRKIRALEIGSGNSSTLFSLEDAGILEKGYGVEISKSRFTFAELWKEECGFKCVENINGDVLKLDFNKFSGIDLFICLDFVFHTLAPIKAEYPLAVLKKAYACLHSQGKIVLELDGYDRIVGKMDDCRIKFWQEFPVSDPWRYVLHDCKFDKNQKNLEWRKKYIKRDKLFISESAVILRTYTHECIVLMLKKAGFKKIKLYADWGGGRFKNDASSYIIVGQK